MKKGNVAYMNEARERWFQWKNAGGEPTHERAVAIVQRELGKTNHLGSAYARSTKTGVLNSGLSFLVWDLLQNGRGALDYNHADGFIKNLLEQARQIVSGKYARHSMKIGRRRVSFPVAVKTATRGHQRTQDTTQQEREMAAEHFIGVAKEMVLRWKTIAGVDWPFVRRALAQLCKETRQAWKKAA